MDNRENKRIRKRLTIRFGAGDELKHRGYTEDISPRGLFIKSAMVYRPGSKLLVHLAASDGREALLRAQVRWGKKVPYQVVHKMKAGMGVLILEFLEGEDVFESFFQTEAAKPVSLVRP